MTLRVPMQACRRRVNGRTCSQAAASAAVQQNKAGPKPHPPVVPGVPKLLRQRVPLRMVGMEMVAHLPPSGGSQLTGLLLRLVPSGGPRCNTLLLLRLMMMMMMTTLSWIRTRARGMVATRRGASAPLLLPSPPLPRGWPARRQRRVQRSRGRRNKGGKGTSRKAMSRAGEGATTPCTSAMWRETSVWTRLMKQRQKGITRCSGLWTSGASRAP
mmetsp:Transcript_33150/g.73282  ORF Transcript_33150/g.73282 Transcript_33150/m.73282 type:complete len:214 (+) Transcript_33150:677-1318(+)